MSAAFRLCVGKARNERTSPDAAFRVSTLGRVHSPDRRSGHRLGSDRSVPRVSDASGRQAARGGIARQAGRCARRLIADESGATAIEYGLLVGLLGVVVITAVSLLGN
ncbi:MAG TPA: hypothetical protein DEB67_15515, partial [Oceanicaulis sp.]|nr:hypothetical protein [Oceanicaulis sp.]